MSDFAVAGSELKKLVKLARKQPVGFAFNPGKADSEHYLGMHRKRSGSQISKVAKKEGPGVKVGYGNCAVDGKCLNMTCAATVPAMAKKVKKYLKYNKVMLNVQILDLEGNILDSDIEDDLPDDPDLMDEDQTDPQPDQNDPDQNGPDPAPIHAQLTADQARLSQLQSQPKARETLDTAITAAFALLQSGDLAAAAKRANAITAKIDQLLAAPTGVSSDDLRNLITRLTDLKAQIGQIANPDIQARLTPLTATAADQIKTRDVTSAEATLTRLEKALGSLPQPTQPDPLKTLQNDLKSMVPHIAGIGDPGQKKRLVDLVQDIKSALKTGDPAAAAALLAQLKQDLGPQTAPPSPRLVPIWRDAREAVDKQLGDLQAAMRAKPKPLFQRIADVGFNGITKNELVAMQTALVELDAASGPARETAQQKFATARNNMLALLKDNKLLPLLESNPLGVTVQVRATLARAIKSLDQAVKG